MEEYRLEQPPCLQYLCVTVGFGCWADLYPISIYIISLRIQHYIIRFLSSSYRLEFSSLEVKYDRFRNRDEGTWQNPLIIFTTKDRLSKHLNYVTDVVQPEETSRLKSINTHTGQQQILSLSPIMFYYFLLLFWLRHY